MLIHYESSRDPAPPYDFRRRILVAAHAPSPGSVRSRDAGGCGERSPARAGHLVQRFGSKRGFCWHSWKWGSTASCVFRRHACGPSLAPRRAGGCCTEMTDR